MYAGDEDSELKKRVSDVGLHAMLKMMFKDGKVQLHMHAWQLTWGHSVWWYEVEIVSQCGQVRMPFH
jgi:hypothetical protein